MASRNSVLIKLFLLSLYQKEREKRMKKRHLRKGIENALLFITIVLFIFIATIDDMSMSFIPTYLVLVVVLIINIMILKKYGRGEWYE